MMSQDNNSNTIDVGNELSRRMTIHKNVGQEIIITTDDKIRLVLIKTKDIFISQTEWWTPAGLLISFLTTLGTADFKKVLGISADSWKALFILLTVFSVYWLGKSLIKLVRFYGKNDVEKILENIKKTARQETVQ